MSYVGRTYRHDQKQYAAAHSDGRVIITKSHYDAHTLQI